MKGKNIAVHIPLKTIKTILVVVVLLILIIFSIHFFTSNYEKTADVQKNTSQTNSQTAYKHPTLSDCQNITHRIKKAFCMADVAEINKDPQICEMINFDTQTQIYCRAVTKNNASLCGEISDQLLKQTCFNHTTSK